MGVPNSETIVFGIISRLPAKDIGRFKSVCKEWEAMISTTGFKKIHLSYPCKFESQKTIVARRLTCSVLSMDILTATPTNEKIISFPKRKGQKGISILCHLNGILSVCLQPSHELVLWNPTTGAHKQITHANDMNPFNYVNDTIGLFTNEDVDLNVLRVIRSAGTVSGKNYSTRTGIWRDTTFVTNNNYARRPFLWFVGTQCGNGLYFSVSNYWDEVMNVILKFDTITEQVTQIEFPAVPRHSIFEVSLICVIDTLHMILLTNTTENHDKLISVWSYQNDSWSNCYENSPIPPVTSSTWFTISHYVTNGTWFMMSGTRPLYSFNKPGKKLQTFYSTDTFRVNQGAVYYETITSPN